MPKFSKLKWLWLTILSVLLDQGTKYAVDHSFQLHESKDIIAFFNLTYVQNTGAAFSFLSEAGGWQRWFFVALAFIMSGVIVVWLARLKDHETQLAMALSLILGGAVGNLIDRLLYGYVIDFIDVYYNNLHWPAFNIADSTITIGVMLMFFDSFKTQKVL